MIVEIIMFALLYGIWCSLLGIVLGDPIQVSANKGFLGMIAYACGAWSFRNGR